MTRRCSLLLFARLLADRFVAALQLHQVLLSLSLADGWQQHGLATRGSGANFERVEECACFHLVQRAE
jgi:hypothetical protein